VSRILAVISCFFAIFFSHSLSAKQDFFDLGELYFSDIGDKESLPLCCTAVLQSKDGFIWLGSQRGLIRYDGYRFKYFTHSLDDPESISGNYIISLWEHDGKIWIGTVTGGVSVLDVQSEKFYHYKHDPKNSNGLTHNRVFAISDDKDGNMWFGTMNGLNFLDIAEDKITHYFHSSDNKNSIEANHIHALFKDDLGNLWVGSDKGLNKYNYQKKNFEQVFQEGLEDVLKKGVTSLYQDKAGKLWVGLKSGEVLWIDPATNIFRDIKISFNEQLNIKSSRIKTIAQPNDNEIWLGTYGHGILVVDVKSGSLVRHLKHQPSVSSSINFDYIGQIVTGKSGLMWVATWGGGLNRYNPQNAGFRVLRIDESKNNWFKGKDVSNILELDNGDLLLGSHGKGLEIGNPLTHEFYSIEDYTGNRYFLANKFISGLVQTSDQKIWIGTRGGLQRYDKNTNEVITFTSADGLADNTVLKIAEDSSGNLWVATLKGLVRIRMSDFTIDSPLKDDPLYQLFAKETTMSIVYQPGGYLWVGTTGGLFLVSEKDFSLAVFKSKTDVDQSGKLTHDVINGLLVDSNGSLWVDTAFGLDKLVEWKNGTPIFQSINKQAGWPFQSFGSNLLEDGQGRIWTHSAIYDPRTNNIESLSKAEGVDFGTFWLGSYAKTKDGVLMYGGSEGLLMIEAEKYTPWKFEPDIMISDVRIDGQSIYFVDSAPIILENNIQNFVIEFASTDYSAPEKIKFAYMLDGYDNDWTEVSSEYRTATYTNLNPGKYQLKIRATNRTGKWSSHEYVLTLQQLPKFYQTMWFRFVLFIIFCLIILAAVKIRLYGLRMQRNRLKLIVKERTLELEEKNKALEVALDDLEKVSLTDHLTGVYNRRFLSQLINQELSKLQRHYYNEDENKQSAFGFVVVDIDHFKPINDRYGHDAGDRVLSNFAKILSDTCRESDWVIRWGGEEFLIVGRFVKRDELHTLAQRIKDNIEASEFDIGNGEVVKRTCSIGVTAFPFVKNQFDGLTWEQTLNLADLALYVAKNNGRNIWVSLYEKLIYDPQKMYQQAFEDLAALVEGGIIEYTVSDSNKEIDFDNRKN